MPARNIEFCAARYRQYCRDTGAPCWDEFTTVDLPSPLAAAPGLASFDDALVLSGEWFVVTREFTARDHQLLRPLPAYSLYIAGGRPDRRVLIHDRPIETNIEQGFLLSGAQNYAHWLFDKLPHLQFYDRVPAGTPVILNRPLTRFQTESLAMLGISARDLRTLDYPGAFRVPRLWFPMLASNRYLPPLKLRPEPLDWLRERFLKPPGRTHGSRRLYVSRRATPPAKRRLINDDDVAAVFAEHGFETIVSEDLSFAEQIETFADADIVAGPNGAGLANAAFAPTSCTLIELTGPIVDRWYGRDMLHAKVASLLGQRYVRIVGNGDGTVAPSDQFFINERYLIARDQVESALAAL